MRIVEQIPKLFDSEWWVAPGPATSIFRHFLDMGNPALT